MVDPVVGGFCVGPSAGGMMGVNKRYHVAVCSFPDSQDLQDVVPGCNC